jgi:hypothetical protein
MFCQLVIEMILAWAGEAGWSYVQVVFLSANSLVV